MLNIGHAISRPGDALLHLTSRLMPGLAWRHYSRCSRAAGLDRLNFVLSFDCDTREDAEVVLPLDEKLRGMGARPMYAVPGELLERSAEIYRELHRRGAEFLNHGYRDHTRWNVETGRYESCYFYDELDPREVLEDIRRGDAAVRAVLSVRPTGFRAPHFGTFQRREHLSLLHGELARLGYVYSSSTTPLFGFRLGGRFASGGVQEFPVTGMFSRPLLIQDSWGFFEAPDRVWTPEQYVAEARRTAGFFQANGLVGVLNYYADPSHVWDEPGFFEAVAAWLAVARPALLSELSGASR